MKVAVFGSGPAGLFAAWAAIEGGHSVTIFTDKPAKPVGGATAGVFYLHHTIGLPLRKVHFVTKGFGGTAKDYAKKVYGDEDAPTSWPSAVVYEDGYDGAQAVDLAWDIISTTARIEERKCEWGSILNSISPGNFDFAVNTIPLKSLGFEGLEARQVFVHTGKAPMDEAYVMYNAHPDSAWYRASALFGKFAMEMTHIPADFRGEIYPVQKVIPPQKWAISGIRYNSRLILTGRYGAWDKTKLSDDAYHDTKRALRNFTRIGADT